MGEALGVEGQLWNRLKRGEGELGAKILAGVAKAFPTLSDDIVRYLTARKWEG